MTDQNKSFERLPKDVVPNNYNIRIVPNIQEFSFLGRITVNVRINMATDRIVLNALDISISKSEFCNEAGEVVKSKSIELNSDNETAVITFESILPIGKGELYLEYKGQINDLLVGFYRSKYTTADGEERFCAVTHFEPTHARRVFPCWDEPAIKATFDITLVVPKDRLALSNMNVVREKETGSKSELREVVFARTPIMSTYLVAFIVGEYDFVETHSSDGVLVRVYTPLGKKEQGEFALGVAAKSLTFFKKYFNMADPLPKMDLIALADMGISAMENWGLVTYRESCLLLDPHNTSSTVKQFIAIVVAHELSHQWFGNLVTMEWWTDLWLKEGFASFMQHLCVNQLFPEYDIWTQFLTDMFCVAQDLDALSNSHPIEVPVSNPKEIDEIFDHISYNKGASIIRMLHKYVGDEVFRKALHNYLKTFAYSNCVTDNLWEALEDASGKPVQTIMSTWTKQKGFPVVMVSSKQDGHNQVLSLTQEKFNAEGKAECNSLWSVPINISTSANPEKPLMKILLDKRSTQVVLENVAEDKWIIVNPGASGFYRVMYSKEMLSKLLPSILDQSLPPIDRLTLHSDMLAMVQAGRVSTLEILKLLEAYANETNYTVWSSISSCLSKLNILVCQLEFQNPFFNYIRKLFTKIHSKLGWEAIEGEHHTDGMLRSLVLSWLTYAQDETVLAEAKRRFESHASSICILPADIRKVVYDAAAAQGDGKTYQTLLNLYRQTELHEERNRLSMALGAFKDKELIRRTLEFSFSGEVRNQDTVFIIISVAQTKPGQEMAWNFFQEVKDKIVARYDGNPLFRRLVQGILKSIASEEKAQEVEAFFVKNNWSTINRAVLQSLETIRLNARWLDRDQDMIKSYFTSQ